MDYKEMLLDYKEQNIDRLSRQYVLNNFEAFLDKMIDYDYIDAYDIEDFCEDENNEKDFNAYVEEKFREACEEYEASQIL